MGESGHAMDRRDFLGNALALAGSATLGGGFLQSCARTEEALPSLGGFELQFATALEAADAIRKRRISSAELTQHMFDRIERHNSSINAVVTLMHEEAMRQATRADLALSLDKNWGPLHGVPITIKDTYEVRGVRTTAGSQYYSTYHPEHDAEVVSRLRRAGAVIIGKTNTPEMAGDVQTYNDVFGQTNNPWNVARTSGGSTGGGAAAVAAGLSYLSIGSDIGGSIRTPSNFCGVYGHKPTLNLVSLRGHIPPPVEARPVPAATLPVAGPLARSPEDLKMALEIIGGPAGDSAEAYRWSLPPARKARLSDYKIGYVLDDPNCPVTPETGAQLQRAIEALSAAGARVTEGWPEGVDPKKSFETYFYLLMAAVGGGLPMGREEYFRKAARTEPPSLMTLRARAWTDTHEKFKEMERLRMLERQNWRNYFREFDAFLLPVTFTPAFAHDHSNMDLRILETSVGTRSYLDLFFYVSFATLAGLPATSAPVGLTEEGLPVGIQIVGPYLEDATPLDIASHLAKRIGGYAVPPGYFT